MEKCRLGGGGGGLDLPKVNKNNLTYGRHRLSRRLQTEALILYNPAFFVTCRLCLSHVTFHLSLMPTATPSPANSPIIHSRLVPEKNKLINHGQKASLEFFLTFESGNCDVLLDLESFEPYKLTLCYKERQEN